MGDITRELERWYQTEFSFQEEQLKEIKVTATFDLMGNEPLGNVIDVIEEIANVGCERREGSVVISRKKISDTSTIRLRKIVQARCILVRKRTGWRVNWTSSSTPVRIPLQQVNIQSCVLLYNVPTFGSGS